MILILICISFICCIEYLQLSNTKLIEMMNFIKFEVTSSVDVVIKIYFGEL